MNVMVYFFKLVYVLRKKAIRLRTSYLLAEYRYLYGERINISGKLNLTAVPDLYFDQSASKLVLYPEVTIRGKMNMLFFSNGLIEIGKNTFFNQHCSINCMEMIKIGDNCLFGENVKLYDHNHQFKDPHQLINKQGYSTAPILIGNNCWVGSNVTILKGVTIGNNCVVGAGCLVYKDLAANSILYKDTSSQVVKAL